jgi:hypothetical protein
MKISKCPKIQGITRQVASNILHQRRIARLRRQRWGKR